MFPYVSQSWESHVGNLLRRVPDPNGPWGDPDLMSFRALVCTCMGACRPSAVLVSCDTASTHRCNTERPQLADSPQQDGVPKAPRESRCSSTMRPLSFLALHCANSRNSKGVFEPVGFPNYLRWPCTQSLVGPAVYCLTEHLRCETVSSSVHVLLRCLVPL